MNNLTINNTFGGGTVTLTAANTVTGTLTLTAGTLAVAPATTLLINGTIDCGTNIVTGASTFTLAAGGTLKTANTVGITLAVATATGSIRTTVARTFPITANYTYNGTANQVTGSGLTGAVNMTLANTAGVVALSNNVAITGTLTIPTGNTLAVSTFTVTGAGTFTLAAGGTLQTANTVGISALGTATGSILTTVARNFNTAANYTYNSTAASQATGTGLPATVNNLTLNNTFGGGIVTLTSSNTVAGTLALTAGTMAVGANALTVSGIIDCGTNTVTGAGTFTLSSGGTLRTANTAGITTSGATGSIQTTTRAYNSGANYEYKGIAPQVTGSGLPVTVNNLTINDTAGVSLSGSTGVNNTLTMTAGNIALGSFNLTLGNGSTAGTKGTLSYTTGYITGTGTLTRWFDASTIAGGDVAGRFPLGTALKDASFFVSGDVTTGGTVSVGFNSASGATQFTIPDVFTDGGILLSHRHNMNWAVSTANSFAGTGSPFSIQLHGDAVGSSYISDVTKLAITLTNGIAPGTHVTGTGTASAPTASRTALSTANLSNTFYMASSDNNALPVQLTAFTAAITGQCVHLKWRTATEKNNSGFAIERSNDKKGWVSIGFVVGNGVCNSPKEYLFKDTSLTKPAVYYYRLKQIDTDGQFEYSQSIEAGTFVTKFAVESNYPNPFNPTTTIKYSLDKAGMVSVKIHNNLGRLVATLQENEHKEAGIYELTWNASAMPSGVYFYTLNASGTTVTRKMSLLK